MPLYIADIKQSQIIISCQISSQTQPFSLYQYLNFSSLPLIGSPAVYQHDETWLDRHLGQLSNHNTAPKIPNF